MNVQVEDVSIPCAAQGSSHIDEARQSCAQVGRGWWLAPGWGWLCHTLQAGVWLLRDTWPWESSKWTSVTPRVWHLFVVQMLPALLMGWSLPAPLVSLKCFCSPQAAKPQLHTNGRERDKGARDKTHPVRSVLGGDLAWKRTELNPTNQNGEILSPSWVAFSVFAGC